VTQAGLALVLLVVAGVLGDAARAQPPGREIDRLRLRLAPPDAPGAAARPGRAQDLRDARRRVDGRADIGAGHDRAVLRRLERGLAPDRESGPALGRRQVPRRRSRILDLGLPEVGLDPDDLDGATAPTR